jgi:hypothetical protein
MPFNYYINYIKLLLSQKRDGVKRKSNDDSLGPLKKKQKKNHKLSNKMNKQI